MPTGYNTNQFEDFGDVTGLRRLGMSIYYMWSCGI
jgi:hypothetical protein